MGKIRSVIRNKYIEDMQPNLVFKVDSGPGIFNIKVGVLIEMEKPRNLKAVIIMTYSAWNICLSFENIKVKVRQIPAVKLSANKGLQKFCKSLQIFQCKILIKRR